MFMSIGGHFSTYTLATTKRLVAEEEPYKQEYYLLTRDSDQSKNITYWTRFVVHFPAPDHE